jgi:hypothetical protein
MQIDGDECRVGCIKHWLTVLSSSPAVSALRQRFFHLHLSEFRQKNNNYDHQTRRPHLKMTEDASNHPEDGGGQRGPGTGPEFREYRERHQETASDLSGLTDFEDEEQDEEDAMEIYTNKETNQTNQTNPKIEKPNPETTEANPPTNLNPSSSHMNPSLPNPQPTNLETPENPPQTLHTDFESPAKLISPKELKKPAAKGEPKRTEQRDRNRARKASALATAAERTLKARRSERIIEKLIERSTRNQQRPPSPMDMEVPEAGEDAQMMLESTTTETMGQENTATPKEAKEKPNTTANRDQAPLMIYNAIVESNNKVDRISQEL